MTRLYNTSSSRDFPIIWGRRNLFFSLPLCPVQYVLPPHLTRTFQISYKSFAWFSASTILPSSCPSSFLLTCPYHFSLFSVTFFVTGATLTDPPSVVTPHIHFSILISFTSSLFSWLFCVAHVSAPYTNAGCSEIFHFSLMDLFLLFALLICICCQFTTLLRSDLLVFNRWSTSLLMYGNDLLT